MPLHGGRWVVGKIVADIGQSAGVIVDERQQGSKIVRKFASAHDLRRAFGQRWAPKIMPTVLRELMRHEDIGTTMKYYVGQNAETTADALWATVGNTQSELGNTLGNTADSDKSHD